jgi:hypothetical protein
MYPFALIIIIRSFSTAVSSIWYNNNNTVRIIERTISEKGYTNKIYQNH